MIYVFNKYSKEHDMKRYIGEVEFNPLLLFGNFIAKYEVSSKYCIHFTNEKSVFIAVNQRVCDRLPMHTQCYRFSNLNNKGAN